MLEPIDPASAEAIKSIPTREEVTFRESISMTRAMLWFRSPGRIYISFKPGSDDNFKEHFPIAKPNTPPIPVNIDC